jgi:hypothetical protein
MESDEEEVGCLKLYTEKLGFMHRSEKSSKFLIFFCFFSRFYFIFGFCGDSVKHVEYQKKLIVIYVIKNLMLYIIIPPVFSIL